MAAEAPAELAMCRRTSWRIMPLIMICYFFAFFDRINISFAKFQLQSDLGLSDTAYGWARGCSWSATCCSKCRAT
jgi:sugar phosphate permease